MSTVTANAATIDLDDQGEEQTATTSEVSRSISEVARGGAEIGTAMNGMTEAASDAVPNSSSCPNS